MTKEYFLHLLRQQLEGNTTTEEQAFINKYYSIFKKEPHVLDGFTPDEKYAIRESLKENVWAQILRQEGKPKNPLTIRKKIAWAAAAAVLVLAMLSAFFFTQNEPEVAKARIAKIQSPVDSSKNRVILLPDGSTVILGKNSKLDYPSTFQNAARREVTLEGQAFFDIRHLPDQPFIVHTGVIQTKVLGTAFNIKAFPGEDEITVTVKRGKVSVNDDRKLIGIVTPNQQIKYARSKVKSVVEAVSNENYLEWKKEDLLIDNLTIYEAASLLEDRYNVEITTNLTREQLRRFTTTFSKDETLEETLTSICLFNNLEYKYDNQSRKVIISLK